MKSRPFDSGVVTVSLDTELGWARVNSGEFDDIAHRLDDGRTGIRRLLDTFDKYDIPATWALVGRLLDPEPPSADLERLPTIAADVPWERDWWRMPSIVSEIRSANAEHEIGSHSGSHLIYRSLSPAQAQDDLDNFQTFVGAVSPNEPTSFVFPQNDAMHTDILAERGFNCYRGTPPLGSTAPTPTPSLPRLEGDLVNVPLSAGFRHFEDRNPLLRHAPNWVKVFGMRLGVRIAARTGRVYHVALHPKDFALGDGERLLKSFELWLRFVDRMRRSGRIAVLPMSEVVERSTR